MLANNICIYCKEQIRFSPTNKQICMSKKCFDNFAFDHDKPLNIYNESIQDFFLELAKTASKIPDRFSPVPENYNENCLNKNSQDNIHFMNYMSVCMKNIMITEDVFQLTDANKKIYKLNSYSFEYRGTQSQNLTYLFHGSPFHNWYSIMLNGLKNYSGTNKMTSGAVHGNGIYFSDNLSVSAIYAHKSNERYAIGVFEVIMPDQKNQDLIETKSSDNRLKNSVSSSDGDPVREYYRKSSGIYVVPDEKCVRLKHIVVLNGVSELTVIGTNLIKHFRACLNIQTSTKIKMSSLAMKRLGREKNSLLKLFPNLIIEEFESNVWLCTFIGDELKSIRISFPHDYPISAPDITSDLSTRSNPHIINGHFCMDILYNWKMNYCLDMVVLTALQILNPTSTPNTNTDPNSNNWNEIKENLMMLKYFE